MTSSNESSRKDIEILKALSEHGLPVGSTVLRRELQRRGFLLSERTIRYHLRLLDERGLTEGHDRSGRTITPAGLQELSRALAYQRTGFVLTRFLSMAYAVTYNPSTEEGKVVANVSIIDKTQVEQTLDLVGALRKAELLPAPYIKVLDEEEEYESISVPKGKIALFTVCNLTIDGVLIHAGIPLLLSYGGLVQFLHHKPVRFVELIAYEGTTIPPLEVFVYRDMTSINRVLRTGSGMLPANLREAPADAKESTERIISGLKEKGWGGILAFGQPNEPILGVPVGMDRFGISMIGGLIPAAAIRETGAAVDTFAPHLLIPIEDMKRI